MSDDKQDLLREHSYDGIQEYDNQLPRWWVYKFLITIIFAAAYLYWFQFSDLGKGLYDEFVAHLKERASVASQAAPEKTATEEELRGMVKDPQIVKLGSAIFSTRCVSCHANDGGGLIGPNLTDDYWIHGNQMTDIVRTISNGVVEKGMVPWKGILTQDEIHHVAAFVKSIHGSKTAAPKKAEGSLLVEP